MRICWCFINKGIDFKRGNLVFLDGMSEFVELTRKQGSNRRDI